MLDTQRLQHQPLGGQRLSVHCHLGVDAGMDDRHGARRVMQ
jgi:hypothetical protein